MMLFAWIFCHHFTGLNAELASFQTEADCVRKKLLKVEEDLNKYKTKNTELNEELLKKSGRVEILGSTI